MQQRTAYGIILIAFILSIIGLVYVFLTFPPFSEYERQKIKIPGSMEDVKELAKVVSNYTDKYFTTVLIGYSLTYLFLQTFCIPGSLFLSFLGGTLFGWVVGIPLVCFLSACGASGAYLLSYILGKPFLDRYFPQQSKFFGEQIENRRNNLFNYFLFLRFSPLFPNVFVNLASPIFHVPFHIFWIGTFIGVSAQTTLAVNAGLTIQKINNPSDILDFRYLVTLFGLSFLALLPTFKPVQDFFAKVCDH